MPSMSKAYNAWATTTLQNKIREAKKTDDYDTTCSRLNGRMVQQLCSCFQVQWENTIVSGPSEVEPSASQTRVQGTIYQWHTPETS